jgi:hypothetical protein
MATQLQIRRGTTSQMNAFTGAEGELAVNTTTDTVHVHDGSTAGGFALAKADGSNIGTYAGSFTTLAASGAVTLSSTLAVTGALTVDTNTLVVDATNNRVGINTSPSYQLDLKQADTYAASFENPSDDSKLLLGEVSGDWRLAATYGSTGSFKPITFWTSDQKRLTIDASGDAEFSGKVRVGTSTNGTAALMTFDSASNSSALQMGNNSGGAYPGGVLLYSTSSNEFQIYQYSGVVGSETYGGPTLALSSAGNMGLGTASPSRVLEVASGTAAIVRITATDTTPGYAVNEYLNGAGGYAYVGSEGSYGGQLFIGSTAYATLVGNTSAVPLQFATNNNVRATIDASGNLLVGTSTTPQYGGVAVGSTSSGKNINVFSSSNGSNGIIAVYSSDNTQQGQIYAGSGDMNMFGASVVKIVASTGGVKLTSGATSWVSNSDERAKDIIEPITNAVQKVSTLRAVIGKYKTDSEGTRRSFLIAQDVQAVLPEAVDATDEDNLGVRYTETIPLLVAAIKEQQASIEALTQRIETLENN